jgi:hypothetical protein
MQFLFLIGQFLKIFSETAWLNEPQFQRRRIFKISQSETRIACGGHVC